MKCMLKIIKCIFIYLFCVFLFSTNTLAVTPNPTPSFNISAPGFTCGDASSSDPNVVKCCKMPINSPDLIVPFINEKYSEINFTRSQIKEQPCMVGSPSTPGDTNNNSCICISEPTKAPLSAMEPICNRINSQTGEQSNCKACAQGGGLWTSLGCFSGNLSEFISQKILGTGVGIAGGISLLCIMFAAFQMQTSSGNAEKIKKAQELLTNCITGLMIIVFSILILKIIGVDVLRLPNFGM